MTEVKEKDLFNVVRMMNHDLMLALFGLTKPTVICGICALTMFVVGGYGWITKSVSFPILCILMIVNFVEFPYLFYVYGAVTSVYFI